MVIKRIAAAFALCLSAAAMAQEVPTIDEQPQSLELLYLPTQDLPVKTIAVTVHLCSPAEDTRECDARRELWQHLKDEADLNELILRDFRDAKVGQVNTDLRNHIAVIAARLAKNRFD